MDNDPLKKSRNLQRNKRWIYGRSQINITIPEPLLLTILVLLWIGFLTYCVIVCYHALTQRPVDFITTASTIICFLWIIFGQKWFRYLSTYKQTLLLGASVGAVVAVGWIIDVLFFRNLLTSDIATILLFPLFGLIVLRSISYFSDREADIKHTKKNKSEKNNE